MWLLFPFFLMAEIFMSILGNKIGKIVHEENKIKHIEIFQENFTGLIHHSISSCILLYAMYYNSWCLNNDWSMSLSNNQACIFEASQYISIYDTIVAIEIAHYIYYIIHTCLFKKIKRSDQTMLFIHHIVTLVLIYNGHIFNWGVFGTIYVLFTHNLCDIPIHTYLLLKNIKDSGANINNIVFVLSEYVNGILLIIMWSYLRLYMYGSLVFYVFYSPDIDMNYIVKICVFILYIFDIKWFFLSLSGIYNEIIIKNNNSTLYCEDDNVNKIT